MCIRDSRAAWRDDHVHPPDHQLGGELGEADVLTLRPTKLYSDIPAFDVAGLGESLTEGAQAACERGRRFSAEIADHRLGCLLRPCPERRQEGAGANRDQEIAPVDGVGHSSSLGVHTGHVYYQAET